MARQIFLYVMVLFYFSAGVNHFVNPEWYIPIIPPWMPAPNALNYISGACEIMFAILLIPPTTRVTGAWLIIALLIAIFPANIQMSINFWDEGNPNFWITIIRLPLQLALIWWAWQYTRASK